MPERTYTSAELGELAAGLRRLLDAIEAGTLAASSGQAARLEGAWLAVQGLATGRPIGADDLLGEESLPPTCT